jgi:hypothetical protein
MSTPDLTMEERIEQVAAALRDLDRAFAAFAVRVEKRLDEMETDLKFIVADARAKNTRISILETRIDEPASERPTLPSPDST